MSKDLNKTDNKGSWIDYYLNNTELDNTETYVCDGPNPTLEEHVLDNAYHYVKGLFNYKEIVEHKNYTNGKIPEEREFNLEEKQFSGKDMIEAYTKGFSFHGDITAPKKAPFNLKRKKVLDVMKQLISFAEGLPVFQIRVTYRARYEDIKNYIEEDSKTMNTEWTQYYGMTPEQISERRLEKYSSLRPDDITDIAFMQCLRTSDITYEEAEKILDSKIKNAKLLKIELPQ